MLLPRRLALAAVALAASSCVVSAANTTLRGWYGCSQYSLEEEIPTADAGEAEATFAAKPECAIFQAPLCYDGVCNDAKSRTIDVFVKRYVTPGKSEGKPNVIFMQGGPGAASPAMESAMTGLTELLGEEVNVYTLDHRGTGRSTKFDCVAVQALTSGSPGGRSVSEKEVGDCAQELENKYSSDLSSFSVTSAASDLKYFIANFLGSGKTYVYGVSYGTLLVERLMHLDPPGVAGYILDGIATTSGAAEKDGLYMSMWDVNMNEVAESFLDACADNNEFCGQYFKGTTVKGELRSLLSNLLYSTAECTDFLDTQLAKTFGYTPGQYSPSGTLRQVFGQLLQSYTLRDTIPVLTYRLSRCTTDDKKVLTRFFDKLSARLQSPSEEDNMDSDLLYGLIVYSELWESPPPTDRQANQRFTSALMGSGVSSSDYCAFTKDSTSLACGSSYSMLYSASPISYKKDEYWNVAAKPPANVSVLLLSGKLDPQTPHKYAEYLLAALNTENKELVAFDYASHGALWNTPMLTGSATCGLKILASYVSNGGKLAAMDKSCIAQTAKHTFQLPSAVLSSWLNTTSAYDGEYIGPASTVLDSDGKAVEESSSTPFKSVFLVFLVLFILALVFAIVFSVLWRRAKQKRSMVELKEVAVYEEATA